MHVCTHMYSCMYIHMEILGSGPRLIDLDYTHMYTHVQRTRKRDSECAGPTYVEVPLSTWGKVRAHLEGTKGLCSLQAP